MFRSVLHSKRFLSAQIFPCLNIKFNQLIIRSIWECIFPIVNKQKYLLFLLRSTTKNKQTKKKKKKQTKKHEMTKFKRVRVLTATSSFQVEWSNWGSYGKNSHFSFKWAKPTLLHSFNSVLPIFYFTKLPIAQFSAAKVWLWIIIIIIKKKKKKKKNGVGMGGGGGGE